MKIEIVPCTILKNAMDIKSYWITNIKPKVLYILIVLWTLVINFVIHGSLKIRIYISLGGKNYHCNKI